jgi:hypothetical protein
MITTKRMNHIFRSVCVLTLTSTALFAAETVSKPAPQKLPRTTEKIEIDGDLSDPGWRRALVIDKFYETSPGDNIPAKVKTIAYLAYDDEYFYIGIECEDPEPKRIRAPYVERDQVLGTDDNIAVFLDTSNDKKSALELRISPRGIQADGIFDDVNTIEDFAPDFFYDTAAKVTPEGWQGEFRIPLTTLRYPETDPQTWGILIWRNYPRDFRYAFHSGPIDRGSNCLVCHTHELTGITQLPTSNHLVVAPYVTGSHLSTRDDFDEFDGESDADFGVDLKWNPTANSTIDATVQPDFSQVESDVPQIAVNQRFALFFPEKRPFFLEGADLFNSPLQIVYTRTITDPQWGLRATGKIGGDTSYTVLSGRDEGGGLVILPGPASSGVALQDFKSYVTLGRLRHDFGRSYGSFMLTDREVSGGGHNRVFGPDAQWRPTDSDIVTGQLLFSSTEDPIEPPFFNGQSSDSYAGQVQWDHQVRRYDWRLRYTDAGEEFRADIGFIPQVGFRQGMGAGGFRFYPDSKWFRFIRLYGVAEKSYFQDGDDLGHDYFPGIFLIGTRNLNAQFEFHDNKVFVSDRLLTQRYFSYFVSFDPARKVPRITLFGRIGDLIDFDNARVGTGTNITLQGQFRPTDHLTLVADAAREWLDVEDPLLNQEGRLYTANIARLKAVYVFNARSFVRAIGQYVSTTRDPSLFGVDVVKRDGDFLASVLYGYRLNWQTVLFVGYGDNGIVDEGNSLVRTNRSFFVKVSYAWQR